jgi:hypothetical protein
MHYLPGMLNSRVDKREINKNTLKISSSQNFSSQLEFNFDHRPETRLNTISLIGVATSYDAATDSRAIKTNNY